MVYANSFMRLLGLIFVFCDPNLHRERRVTAASHCCVTLLQRHRVTNIEIILVLINFFWVYLFLYCSSVHVLSNKKLSTAVLVEVTNPLHVVILFAAESPWRPVRNIQTQQVTQRSVRSDFTDYSSSKALMCPREGRYEPWVLIKLAQLYSRENPEPPLALCLGTLSERQQLAVKPHSPQSPLLEQETWGWKVRGLKIIKGKRPTQH